LGLVRVGVRIEVGVGFTVRVNVVVMVKPYKPYKPKH
jgi:hypothetical protein